MLRMNCVPRGKGDGRSSAQIQRWVITVSLAATTDCFADGAVCTDRGHPLSNANAVTVAGPALISVADAQVPRGRGGAGLLGQLGPGVQPHAVGGLRHVGRKRPGWRGLHGGRGTLVFLPGETTQTVRVAMLGEAMDEGNEMLTLTNSAPAWPSDGEATGIILR